MCKAFTLTRSSDELIQAFRLKGGNEFSPSFNITPTQLAPVIIQGDKAGLSSFYWGATPSFARNKSLAEKLYNLKSEAISASPVHRLALQQYRCLIPADGFYAWRQISKKGLIPYYYFLGDNSLFAFAGLWQEFEELDGKVVHTFSLLTTTANELVAQTTPRMPVIFNITEGMDWLQTDEKEAYAMLKAYPEDKMGGFAVSAKVNKAENNDPSLIAPVPPADQFGNYSLFD